MRSDVFLESLECGFRTALRLDGLIEKKSILDLRVIKSQRCSGLGV
jgi:hypothetical protein